MCVLPNLRFDYVLCCTYPAENGAQGPENLSPSARSWISSVSVCRSSDLAASGAGNGSVRLWAIQSESRGISPLFELPMVSLTYGRWLSYDGVMLIGAALVVCGSLFSCADCFLTDI